MTDARVPDDVPLREVADWELQRRSAHPGRAGMEVGLRPGGSLPGLVGRVVREFPHHQRTVPPPTGKKWGNYWQNKTTKGFVETLAADVQICTSGLVQVTKGGNNKGEQG